MTEFINWETLGTYGGALVMTSILTQFTKELSIIKRIPTQIWSYILALIVLVLALIFTGGFTLNTFAQSLFNAVIVSIAANGGYGVFQKMTEKSTDEK